MKGNNCLTVSVAILAITIGIVLFNFEEQPESFEDVVLELFTMKSRLQFGVGNGKCASRGTDEYLVSCRHRAFEEMFTTFEIGNLNIIHESGVQAYIDSTTKNLRNMEAKTMHSAAKKYSMIDMYDTTIHGLSLSVASPPSHQSRTSFGGPTSNVAVFLHAGGYAFGWSQWAAEFRARLAYELDIPVLSLNYTLSIHESPAVSVSDVPTFLREARSLLEWLSDDQNTPWSNIVVIGDSAGGGMAVSLINYLQRSSGENVRLCVGISAWTETCEYPENESAVLNANVDPMIDLKETKVTSVMNFIARDKLCFDQVGKPVEEMPTICQQMIAKGCENQYWNPRRLADYTGVKTKFLLQVAKGELLRDDSALLHDKLVKSGVQSELLLSPTNIHVLPTMFPWMEDGDRIVTQIVEWIRTNLKQY